METQTHDKAIAPLRNVQAMAELIERVQTRTLGLPGMAAFHGPSGYGKSCAAIWCASQYSAAYVQVKSIWRPKSLCEALMRELDLPVRGTVAEMVDVISAELALTGRLLLIDEADHLINCNMIEIIRDLYEGSQMPVILIGEESLPLRLTQWERVHGRMLDWVGAAPGIEEDVAALARIYCPSITLDAASCARVLEKSRGSIRRIAVNLARLAEADVLNQDLGNVTLYTGVVPKARALT